MRFEQRIALLAVNQLDGPALAQAFNAAPHIFLNAFKGGRTIELQQEILLFINLLERAWAQVLDERPAAIEFIAAYPVNRALDVDLNPERTCKVQFTPGVKSFSNSNTDSRSLIQRPLPLVAWALLQLKVRGAAALRSPKFTALVSNLTTTCLNWTTSRRGVRLVICSASACSGKAVS